MNDKTSFICVINNISTIKYYDEGQCIVLNIAANLYKYDFGYFCMGIIGIIIFISIFGGIKQNYRWFFLNQAIWDLIKSYDFSCDNYVKPSPECFYYTNNGIGTLDITTRAFILNNIYSPLLTISLTRFTALYFVKFYDKLTRGYRIIFTIIIFNLFLMFWDTPYLFAISDWITQRNAWLIKECQIKQSPNSSNLCSFANTKDFITDLSIFIFRLGTNIRVFKPALSLLISSFFASMIILKVAKQAKFQLKHNRRDFLNSTCVAIVIASQIIMNLFIFVFQFLGYFPTFVSLFTSVPIVTIKFYVDNKNYTGYIDFRLPLWIDGTGGLTSLGGQQIITQTRIFIESIIILCIMTGYREAIVKILKQLYFRIRNPLKFIKSFKNTSVQNSWT